MEIVVVADTHLPKGNREIPGKLKKEMKKADLVIHAGDWQTIDVYEQFREFGELAGVYGNIDHDEIKEVVPRRELLHIKGFTIGVVHGHGEKKTTEKRVYEEFAEDEPDVIIFGHSHLPLLRFMKKTMLFNPGSATDKRRVPYYSYGKLTIQNQIHAEHVFYSSLR
ncbi:metallophosphoesterase family protein [Halobacillus sp. A5]|uniref:metallophosphoesterase family protein n=1 Tax=Halobacillus sp. A5 TaxID=2880263 RepID=UPI0020A664C0|nr:metallophosphoesterase family protein [Halobacillus sp. A5]MCP3026936.1 YfcE family phosphodiesterase [Halobacillus sp. A5]